MDQSEQVLYETNLKCTLKLEEQSYQGKLSLTNQCVRWEFYLGSSSDEDHQEEDNENRYEVSNNTISMRYQDFICFGESSDQSLAESDSQSANGQNLRCIFAILKSENYAHLFQAHCKKSTNNNFLIQQQDPSHQVMIDFCFFHQSDPVMSEQDGMMMDGGNAQAYDDCDQLELVFIPESSHGTQSNQNIQIQDEQAANDNYCENDEVSIIRKAFEEGNMMHPDSDQEESDGEGEDIIYTKEYFEELERQQAQGEQEYEDSQEDQNEQEENENTMDLTE